PRPAGRYSPAGDRPLRHADRPATWPLIYTMARLGMWAVVFDPYELLPVRAPLSDKSPMGDRTREDHMKFYMHPVSMTCRPIRLFMAEKGLKADEVLVDLMTGAHYQEPYASINPNRL